HLDPIPGARAGERPLLVTGSRIRHDGIEKQATGDYGEPQTMHTEPSPIVVNSDIKSIRNPRDAPGQTNAGAIGSQMSRRTKKRLRRSRLEEMVKSSWPRQCKPSRATRTIYDPRPISRTSTGSRAR